MYITDFQNLQVIGPKEWLPTEEDFTYYELPTNKWEFYCTKYAEFDYGVPRAKPGGLYVEMGVFKGRSIKYLAKAFPEFHWYGFDTFEGIDALWEMGGKNIDMNQFKTNVPEVPENVTLIKGLFEETLEEWVEQNKDNYISFVNMDADMYEPTKYAMTVLNPLLVPGTVIRFDELSDWRVMGYEKDPEIMNLAPDTKYTRWRDGEWKALKEWMLENDRDFSPMWRNWHQSAGIKVVR